MRKLPKFEMFEACVKAGAEGYVLARARGVEDIIAADGLWVVLERARLDPARLYMDEAARPILDELTARTEAYAEQLLVDQQR